MLKDGQMFDKESVVKAMNSIGSYFTDVGSAYSTADAEMSSKLTTADGAMYGEAATKILSAWDENSGTLDDFMDVFANWSALVSGMANKFTNLQEGTYIVTDEAGATQAAILSRNARTTALKTKKGIEGFTDAQNAYATAHPDEAYLDQYGLGFTGARTLQNGKIVEKREYDGGLKAEQSYVWDAEQGKYVWAEKYYDSAGNEITDEAAFITELAKDPANVQAMKEYWRNKYGAEYIQNPDGMSEEAKKAFERLPENVQTEIKEELDIIAANKSNMERTVETDENGNVVSITYSDDNNTYIYDKDGNLTEVTTQAVDENGVTHTFTIKYEKDENGNIVARYYQDGTEVPEDSINEFYTYFTSANNENQPAPTEEGKPSTGAGNTGGIVTTNEDGSYTVKDGDVERNVTIKDGDHIIIDGVEYEKHVDSDNNVYYTNATSNIRLVDKDAKMLEDTLRAIAETNPAVAAQTGMEIDGRTYGYAEDGKTIISTQEVTDPTDSSKTHKVVTTYDDNGNPTGYTVDGIPVPDDMANDYEKYLANGKLNGEDGSDISYSVDPVEETITRTETGKNGEIREKTYNKDGELIREYIEDESGRKLETTNKETEYGSERTTIITDGNETHEATVSVEGSQTKYFYDGQEVSHGQYDNLIKGSDGNVKYSLDPETGDYIETEVDGKRSTERRFTDHGTFETEDDGKGNVNVYKVNEDERIILESREKTSDESERITRYSEEEPNLVLEIEESTPEESIITDAAGKRLRYIDKQPDGLKERVFYYDEKENITKIEETKTNGDIFTYSGDGPKKELVKSIETDSEGCVHTKEYDGCIDDPYQTPIITSEVINNPNNHTTETIKYGDNYKPASSVVVNDKTKQTISSTTFTYKSYGTIVATDDYENGYEQQDIVCDKYTYSYRIGGEEGAKFFDQDGNDIDEGLYWMAFYNNNVTYDPPSTDSPCKTTTIVSLDENGQRVYELNRQDDTAGSPKTYLYSEEELLSGNAKDKPGVYSYNPIALSNGIPTGYHPNDIFVIEQASNCLSITMNTSSGEKSIQLPQAFVVRWDSNTHESYLTIPGSNEKYSLDGIKTIIEPEPVED